MDFPFPSNNLQIIINNCVALPFFRFKMFNKFLLLNFLIFNNKYFREVCGSTPRKGILPYRGAA